MTKNLIEKMEKLFLEYVKQEVACDADESVLEQLEQDYRSRFYSDVSDLIQSVGEELIGRDEADEDRIDLGWLKKEYRDDLRSEQRSRLAEIISEIKKG